MNPAQVPNSEDFPSSFIATFQDNNILTAPNLEQAAESSTGPGGKMYLMTSAPQTSGNRIVYDDYTQLMSLGSARSYQPPQQALFSQIPPVHSNIFIYRPPNNYCQYYVKCENFSNDLVIQSLNKIKENIIQLKKNEYIFFYQQKYNYQIYQISCEIVPPSFINNYLNKTIHGIEIEQNMEQEQLAFTSDQEKNLEIHLSQYLSNYLLN